MGSDVILYGRLLMALYEGQHGLLTFSSTKRLGPRFCRLVTRGGRRKAYLALTNKYEAGPWFICWESEQRLHAANLSERTSFMVYVSSRNSGTLHKGST